LFKKLVPSNGNDASTPHGRALQYVSQIYYDIYNNGACNLGIPYFVTAHEFLIRVNLTETVKSLGLNEHRFYTIFALFLAGKDRDTNDDVMDVLIKYAEEQEKKKDTPLGIHILHYCEYGIIKLKRFEIRRKALEFVKKQPLKRGESFYLLVTEIDGNMKMKQLKIGK
jgi:hypothetical protein